MRINTITKAFAVAAVATVAATGTAVANDDSGMANENAPSCTLSGGQEFTAPGFMFQHLRDRDYNLAGTPKVIADEWFDGNVKNLLDAKCDI
jgi:hypothetical protein